MSLRTHLVVIAGACLLAACGDDSPEPVSTTAAAPSATAQASATPTATATASPAATIPATPTPTIPPATEEEPGGGDEGGNRVDLHFDLLPRTVMPRQLEVPAFLGLRIRVRNQSATERIVRIDGKPVLELLPGQAESAEVEGLRPGDHVLDAGDGGRAILTAVRAG